MNTFTSPIGERYNHLRAEVRAELRKAAQAHAVATLDLLRESHSKPVVAARLDVMRWLRARGYSYPAIGRVFQMSHTTVMHHLKSKPEPAPPPREPAPFPDESGIWAI